MNETPSPHVRLAAEAISLYVIEGQTIAAPDDLPEEFTQRMGAFVCIKRDGTLRGCIGTIEPSYANLGEEIINNAIAAATTDPRFHPISRHELSELELTVDVLQPAERIYSLDDLDVKRYGVIVRCGHRRGLLLPDLDGVDTPEQQVEIAMQKAGIHPNEEIDLFRFEVTRHH